MSRINNQASGDFGALERRIRALETAAPMNNAAVGRSGFEVYDGGTINVSSGTLLVNGLASISGTLNADGTVTLSGEVRVTGPFTITGNTSVTGDFTVTGPTHLNGQTDIGGNTSVTGDLDVKGPLDVTGRMTVTGDTKLDGKTDIGGDTTVTGDLDVKGPLDVTGTMDIKGKSTLQNDLDVRDGGKITVGGMTLDPSRDGGSVSFVNGAYLISNSGVTSLAGSGVAYLTLSDDMAQIRGVKVSLNGQLSNPNHATTSSDTKPNVYMDASGNIKRILPG